MGVVYKARQVSLNRTVAVKMILSGQLASASAKDWFGAMFHLERLLQAAPDDEAVRKRHASACLAYTNLLQRSASRSSSTTPNRDRDAATK